MSKYIFLFDLDATITRCEILPAIAKRIGKYDEIRRITDNTMRGELPFKQSFLRRVDLLKEVAITDIHEIVDNIDLNIPLIEFILDNRARCYIVTGNLDVWIEPIVSRLGMHNNIFSSKASVKNDHIDNIFSVLDKGNIVQQIGVPFVAVGDGNNDAEMIEAAEIGIGYGGVRDIATSVIECATHAFYDEKKLVEFLKRLL